MLTRRAYIKNLGTLTASVLLSQNLFGRSLRKKVVLLRSSWQTVNIGDIGHTPGVLALLEKHLPDVEVRLWPMSINNGVEPMLRKRFPHVKIVQGEADLARAWQESDFLLHGSGPSLVAAKDIARWKEETSKPYGIYGITFPGFYGPPTSGQEAALAKNIELLTTAQFCYFRDSTSLHFAQEHGARCPVMEFGPDGAFAVDLSNEKAARKFLEQHDLEEGSFLCAIPRQRYTPWWELPEKKAKFDGRKNARNEEMREHDNAPIREAIIEVVRQTPMKVLVCPEDGTQVKLGKQIIMDKLPQDVRNKVVWKDSYWLTDEAVSTYRLSAGLFGLEMHSPIMCIGNGIPALVGRFEEQTSKGIMWKDIGLDEWYFDVDKPEDVKRILPAVLALAKNPEEAKQKALDAKVRVDTLFAASMARLANELEQR
ncbi:MULTISPECIES: polysaccharide pyruvyl transferase family protein [Olivibacter]|jgi:polysaccharide pyruvyl transferase WcaK-like protein|uniref:Polysaccharide pyruvyl transferase family protein n=1 Tax=Olivibacter oleidegradans TaxID=760123 RepID=A0ABV6HHJ6_9SPHI|nr:MULTISPECIES: polysaccharide pyruvyl transferase family protein [Olivibacter]MDM8176692.1 polysaccharide pyruvyl transferase family protein [Olivibacter sp. 47]QEL00516.1 polysaccharide pyruvyl transferase family protein [Olivibacter sp. LS-1]